MFVSSIIVTGISDLLCSGDFHGAADRTWENNISELIRMLTDLFDERIESAEKIDKLKGYGLKLTKDVESEVTGMCTYATAIENKGIEKGIEKGLRALVQSLKEYIRDFDPLYLAVIKNEEYADVSREMVMKYYAKDEPNSPE